MENKELKTSKFDEREERLAEIAIKHLGLPIPGNSDRHKKIQEELLPEFTEMARLSWLMRKIHKAKLDCVHEYLLTNTESVGGEIDQLSELLAEMHYFDLMEDLAESDAISVLSEIQPDPYEYRLLSAAGYPYPPSEINNLIELVASNPRPMENPSATLKEAELACYNAHHTLGPLKQEQTSQSEKVNRKKWKLFTGLGNLFSGLVLLGGNPLLIPAALTAPPTAIAVIGSIAGGIGAILKGTGEIRREGEQVNQTSGETSQKMTSGEDGLFDKKDVAKYLKVSDSVVDRLIRSGELRSIKIGRAVRITREDLNKFIDKLRSG